MLVTTATLGPSLSGFTCSGNTATGRRQVNNLSQKNTHLRFVRFKDAIAACMHADVFVRFRDAEGGFQANDPGDLLRLYNAAHFRTHGETILDEAIAFARSRLEMMLPYVKGPLLAHEVRSSLEIPLPRRVRIYESKYYIHAYETSGTLHEKVLQLAKLNSNVLQLHHQQELKILTRYTVKNLASGF